MFDHHTLSRTISHRLGTGTLHLHLEEGPETPLFRLAERINPKRSFLFVSTVLGRHIPVRPSDHFAAVRELVAKCDPFGLSGPVLVMGYAETAVGLGAAVAREIARRYPDTDPLYLSTTRHPIPGRNWVGFSEGHSHATEHHVLRPDHHPALTGPATLVLVDDETTTGATFAALAGALNSAGLRFHRILLLTLTDWSGGAAVDAVSALCPDIPVASAALLQGRWSWSPDPSVSLPDLPGGIDPAYPIWTPSGSQEPRSGLQIRSKLDLSDKVNGVLKRFDGPILVIGTGEHVWAPMLLAEALEGEGRETRFVATTRSPILTGEVIRDKAIFPDHFGLGVQMYLHNVPYRAGDSGIGIVICTETGADRICPSLKSHLGRGLILDTSGQLTEFCES